MRSDLSWIIWHQKNDLGSLLDYGSLEWQWTSQIWIRCQMWLINVLNEFDFVWCVKGLKLVVSWRGHPWMGIIT